MSDGEQALQALGYVRTREYVGINGGERWERQSFSPSMIELLYIMPYGAKAVRSMPYSIGQARYMDNVEMEACIRRSLEL